MTDKPISNRRKVGSDCFALEYIRTAKKSLYNHLNQFDPNNYWIFKSTEKQKLVSVEEFLKFEYAGYVFFKKDLYNPENILKWCDLIKMKFLVKPTPPDYMLNIIKIIN